jgi:hypothetical protein
VRAAFFGHDHHSDAVFRAHNVYLAYGRAGSVTPPFDWEGSRPSSPCLVLHSERCHAWHLDIHRCAVRLDKALSNVTSLHRRKAPNRLVAGARVVMVHAASGTEEGAVESWIHTCSGEEERSRLLLAAGGLQLPPARYGDKATARTDLHSIVSKQLSAAAAVLALLCAVLYCRTR